MIWEFQIERLRYIIHVKICDDGFSIGYTNAEVKNFLGELMQGSQHQLKMIRTGYVDSYLDILLNDTFTVPTE